MSSTATRLRPDYLYTGEMLRVQVLESEAGAGATIVAAIAAVPTAFPTAIAAALTQSVTSTNGSPAAYTATFTASTLGAELASWIGRRVYLHVYSVVGGWYETYPYEVTATDPDLLPHLLG